MSENGATGSPRRWLQFRLSTILLVVLLFAVAAIWQRDRIELIRLQTQLDQTQQNQQELSAALAGLESQMMQLRSLQETTYRDQNGILRTLDGRPVGIWGVDDGAPIEMPAMR